MRSNYYWDDREVTTWARAYIRKGETLETLEGSMGVSHSTLWWCFTHRLEGINEKLYTKVTKKLETNKHKGGKR